MRTDTLTSNTTRCGAWRNGAFGWTRAYFAVETRLERGFKVLGFRGVL